MKQFDIIQINQNLQFKMFTKFIKFIFDVNLHFRY